jgi:hypothetical protein
MSALTFLNPAYLGALLLGALPIIIHLIRRRKVRVIPWAAYEFLLQSKRRNRRRLRLEQLLLLILRILIVCLAVLAFCRPLMRTLGLPMVAADARVHALIVLDNSFSMGYKRDGITDYARAKRVADDLMGKVLKQGDSVSVVLLSSKPETLIGLPTFDLAKARDRVRSAPLGNHDTDFGVTAASCVGLLKSVKTPTKEVYWITDSQKSGFPDAARERTQAAWKALAGLARITWIDVASQNRDNLSVEEPFFSRELVTPQAPVRVEAAVRNYTNSPRNGLLVNLNVDGRSGGSTRVNVPANGAVKASFTYLFEKPGIHTGTIQLSQPDGLETDNTASFAVMVREKLKILVVNPHPASDPAKDEAFYLVTALAPAGATQGASTAIQPTVHSGSSLAGINLRSYDAVVITGLDTVSQTDRTALQDFVGNGGGLLLFPGPSTDSNRINASLGSGERFLPVKMGTRRLFTEDNALSLNPATITHPALLPFRDTTEINLGGARFSLVYELPSETNDNAVRIMCRFNGGQPAFVERRFGEGKVILAASPAGTSSGSFPFKPAYVPLIHQLVAYLAAGPAAQHNLHVGEMLNARFDVKEAGKPVRLTAPTGQTTLHKTTLGSEGVVFNYSGTDRAGLYQIGLSGRDKVDAFAINLLPGESDLSTLKAAQIQAATGPTNAQFARSTDDLLSVVRHSRRGTEVWRALILAVLPLLFLEGLLAQRFGRRG